MSMSRNFSNISASYPYQMHNRSIGIQEAQELEFHGEAPQYQYHQSGGQSPNQTQSHNSFLPSFFQGGQFQNPEVDHIPQTLQMMPPHSHNMPQNDSIGHLASRVEHNTSTYASPASDTKAATPAGPPKHGIGNLTTPALSEQQTQELLLDSSKHEPGDWVTVFGFPPAATSMILSHFSECGSIEEKKSIPGSNWIHIKYASKIESRRALSKNGTILNATLMIGVVPYNSDGGHPSTTRIRYLGLGQQNADLSINSQLRSPTKRNSTMPTESQPSLINKTFEYLFGW